ncbi:MAG: FkbM family methyltransferase [Vicinamibacteria bacterium]|nr:FkbM family methyltransferase [Vicinamibacteria bacterium]
MAHYDTILASFRSLRRLGRDPEYRRASAFSFIYGLYPRRRPSWVTINGVRTHFCDASSFTHQYEEIFANRTYEFATDNPHPLILDLGANVGVSVLFFKSRYPGARVIAYEADPKVFDFLRRNVLAHRLAGVEIHNVAVWTERGEIPFESDGADAGRLGERMGKAGSIVVPTVPIAEILLGHERIDFLKLDIEGAEDDVLPACDGLLGRVDNLFLEYHSTTSRPQKLDELVGMLKRAGFRLSIAPEYALPAPFLKRPHERHFDLQLNISAYRPIPATSQ